MNKNYVIDTAVHGEMKGAHGDSLMHAVKDVNTDIGNEEGAGGGVLDSEICLHSVSGGNACLIGETGAYLVSVAYLDEKGENGENEGIMNNIDKVSDIMSHKVIENSAGEARDVNAVEAGDVSAGGAEGCVHRQGENLTPLSREEQAAMALEAQGIKPTAMRILVYRELDRARHPVSLKDLEESMVTADRSTIFRTLTLLHDHHVIHAIEDGSGAMKYELCHSDKAHDADEDQHPHFYCESCRRTFCLHDVTIPEVSLPRGYLATAWNFLIKGTCAECLARGRHKH